MCQCIQQLHGLGACHMQQLQRSGLFQAICYQTCFLSLTVGCTFMWQAHLFCPCQSFSEPACSTCNGVMNQLCTCAEQDGYAANSPSPPLSSSNGALEPSLMQQLQVRANGLPPSILTSPCSKHMQAPLQEHHFMSALSALQIH